MDNFDSKSLMIGDWVVYNGDTDYSGPIRVEGMDIATDSLITSDRDDVGFDGVWPIPITIEILKENGFKKDERNEEMYYWNWSVSDNCVSYDKETHVIRIFHTLGRLVFVQPLSYVHELQHALKLCGIEKEIIL